MEVRSYLEPLAMLDGGRNSYFHSSFTPNTHDGTHRLDELGRALIEALGRVDPRLSRHTVGKSLCFSTSHTTSATGDTCATKWRRLEV